MITYSQQGPPKNHQRSWSEETKVFRAESAVPSCGVRSLLPRITSEFLFCFHATVKWLIVTPSCLSWRTCCSPYYPHRPQIQLITTHLVYSMPFTMGSRRVFLPLAYDLCWHFHWPGKFPSGNVSSTHTYHCQQRALDCKFVWFQQRTWEQFEQWRPCQQSSCNYRASCLCQLKPAHQCHCG